MASHSLEKIKNINVEDAHDEQSFFVGEKPVSDEFEGRYEILEEIGKGGMGVVYKARQPALQKLYAIKMLHSVHNNETILRFEREAKAISKLDHVNLITSHDFGVSADGRPYMVMDFIEGTSLAEIISRDHKLPLRQTLEICIQIARGMAYAHAQGVLHRDLKPGNIMLITQPNGGTLVKIIDFGIAKVIEENAPSNLTQTGDVFGSPYYMSPEQAVGRGIDERSDIYSLGCVMYEMLTGVLPFRGASAFETLYAHMNEKAPTLKLNALKEQFPVPVEKLVAKALAKERNDRWQSMTEFENELNSVFKVLDSPFKALLQNIEFETPNFIKLKVWECAALGALIMTILVASILFWPTSQPVVHDKPLVSAQQYLKEQKLDDPNEMARLVIMNGSPSVALDALDCNDDALKFFKQRNDIVKLGLSGTSITGSGLKYLTHLPLRQLFLNQTGVSELSALVNIPTLEFIELNKSLVTSETLASLIQLPNLRSVRAQEDSLNDDAIDVFLKMPSLEFLWIGKNPEFTDAGIDKLSNATRLKTLRLTNLHIGDDSLKNIDRLKNLKVLDLNGTNVTDNSLEKISHMQLRELHLSSTNVTDEGIRKLSNCGTLDRLTLNDCPKVSQKAVDKLAESLAHCKVEHFKKARFR
ncbi:MAG: protein kinase [Cyanobacteria bacterium SZAS-4]|nr:protein kinase [Cyanobacteria bacterium SZAS-4]